MTLRIPTTSANTSVHMAWSHQTPRPSKYKHKDVCTAPNRSINIIRVLTWIRPRSQTSCKQIQRFREVYVSDSSPCHQCTPFLSSPLPKCQGMTLPPYIHHTAKIGLCACQLASFLNLPVRKESTAANTSILGSHTPYLHSNRR